MNHLYRQPFVIKKRSKQFSNIIMFDINSKCSQHMYSTNIHKHDFMDAQPINTLYGNIYRENIHKCIILTSLYSEQPTAVCLNACWLSGFMLHQPFISRFSTKSITASFSLFNYRYLRHLSLDTDCTQGANTKQSTTRCEAISSLLYWYPQNPIWYGIADIYRNRQTETMQSSNSIGRVKIERERIICILLMWAMPQIYRHNYVES